MQYWIQRANFEAANVEAGSADDLIQAFGTHDWSAELRFRSELEARGDEWCDPGFGIVMGDGRILHLCPLDDGSLHCHYHHPEAKRVFGLIPASTTKTETWHEQATASEALIPMVVDGRHEELLIRARRGT